MFYGYCGENSEDAIAIDNIVIQPEMLKILANGTGNKKRDFLKHLLTYIDLIDMAYIVVLIV